MPIGENLPDEVPRDESKLDLPDTVAVYQEEVKELMGVTLEGDPIDATYYSQILLGDDHPERLDMNLSPTLQAYTRINDMVLLGDGSGHDFDSDEHQVSTVELNAVLYPSVVPNRGDHVVHRMSDNQIVFFVVTSVTRVKAYYNSSYRVTYRFVSYMDGDIQAQLNEKTQKTYYFDKDKPYGELLVQQKRLTKREAITKLDEIVNWWYDDHYNKLATTALCTTDSGNPVYDGEVVVFMAKTIPNDVYDYLPRLKVYAIPSNSYNSRYNSIWDILEDGEPTHLRRIDRYSKDVPTSTVRSLLVYSGIGFSSIKYIRIPSKQDTLKGKSEYKPNDDTPTYVFSKAFYDGVTDKMTPLEVLVYRCLNNETVKLDDVVKEITLLTDKEPIERFYQIPVLVWLLVSLVQ